MAIVVIVMMWWCGEAALDRMVAANEILLDFFFALQDDAADRDAARDGLVSRGGLAVLEKDHLTRFDKIDLGHLAEQGKCLLDIACIHMRRHILDHHVKRPMLPALFVSWIPSTISPFCFFFFIKRKGKVT